MEFIRTIRERHQTAKESQVQEMAEDAITLKDFEGSLYIAYNGTPLIEIEEGWTSKEILEKLYVIRSNFINSRMKSRGVSMSVF